MPASGQQRADGQARPARRAWRRMRCATAGRHAGEVCTRILWSVQWNIGENETAWGSWVAETELGVGLGSVAGNDLGGGPVVVVGDQDVLAEQLLLQCCAGGASMVQVSRCSAGVSPVSAR